MYIIEVSLSEGINNSEGIHFAFTDKLISNFFGRGHVSKKGSIKEGEIVKSKNLTLVALFIGILICSLSLLPITNAQPFENAKFENIQVYHYRPDGKIDNFELINGGTAKVYDNDNVEIYLICRNENLPSANLYTKTYINDNLQRIGYIPYPVPTGLIGIDAWPTNLYGPVTQHWRVELWWNNNGENILEDNKGFDIWVVKLFVENWSPAPLTVEKGKTALTSWSINFNNGGNDEMDNVSISVVDPKDLQITPTSQNLDNVIAGGTSSTSFSVTALPLTLTTGQRTVKFQITYYDYMGISHTETMSAPVNVDKLSTSIALSLNPSSVKIDGSSTITAKLIDGNGNPIANQVISFSVENAMIGSVNTNSSGEATQTYTANVDAGTYAVNASFAGTVDYKPSSQTDNLVVEPLTTTIVIIIPSSATLGDLVTIKATLKDEQNRPLENMDVVFQINGNSIGDNNTDSSGIALITYKTSTAGTFKVQAIFGGTRNYVASSSTIANLAVSTSSIALELGIGFVLVVVVVIFGLLIFVRKRSAMKIPFK